MAEWRGDAFGGMGGAPHPKFSRFGPLAMGMHCLGENTQTKGMNRTTIARRQWEIFYHGWDIKPKAVRTMAMQHIHVMPAMQLERPSSEVEDRCKEDDGAEDGEEDIRCMMRVKCVEAPVLEDYLYLVGMSVFRGIPRGGHRRKWLVDWFMDGSGRHEWECHSRKNGCV